MAQEAAKPSRQIETPAALAEQTITHSDIAALAYQLWEDRGRPDGSPEEDWYKAEERLRESIPSPPRELELTSVGRD